MRKIVFIVLALALTGCISTYHGTNSKEVAYISVPNAQTNYQFLGGFSGQNVMIGDMSGNGCMVNVAKVKSTSLNEDKKLVVPAGKEIGLSVSTYQGNTSCGLGVAVTLEAGKNYVLGFGQGNRSCGLGVVEVVGDKLVSLKAERLYPGFSKLCKR